MSEMIERVARALCHAKGINPETCVSGSGWVNAGGGGGMVCHRRAWEDNIGAARAAVEAMREPTSGMKYAAIEGCDADLGLLEARQAWEAMIDAALASCDERPSGLRPERSQGDSPPARPSEGGGCPTPLPLEQKP